MATSQINTIPTPSFTELPSSQTPARLLLNALGYQTLPPAQVMAGRGGSLGQVILSDVLLTQLRRLNVIDYKGQTYPFSEGSLQGAVGALRNVVDDGLISTSEKVFNLLTLGKAFEETINDDKRSFTIRYIDWQRPENNVYHLAEEFEVTGLRDRATSTPGRDRNRRPDLVLFVNGIPLVVIECKRRDKNGSIDEAISQHIRNQKTEGGIPRLFHYAQLLLAVQPNEVRYAVTGTAKKFWSQWREEHDIEADIQAILAAQPAGNDRLPTEQDRMLYALCRPERLLEFIYTFTLFDAGVKKITRYQQYFAVKETLARVSSLSYAGKREGGVIWHTQGSGKSLTMVMLAKALSLAPTLSGSRVLIVTDRRDLDRQISKTFANCGKVVENARSGQHLGELIADPGVECITTLVQKFESAAERREFYNDSANLFVLVDESHRSQYGQTNIKMRKVLPNACYIGFTGTPLLKRDKSTAQKFGGFIHQYPIRQAVEDGAVLPLKYEGRSAKLSVNKYQLDKGFSRVTEPLNQEQRKDFKRKFSRHTEIYKSNQVVEEIAEDIKTHFCQFYQGTGLKAQLAVPLKATALVYQQLFANELNPNRRINTAVIISDTDNRKGHESVDDEEDAVDETEEVRRFSATIKKQYGSLEAYEEQVIEQFNSPDNEVELLIVVNKLLTGFDAPRNTVLYIARHLAEHNLLQAIARVNRLYESQALGEAKEYGLIIDYAGILGELDNALSSYDELSGFDEKDLQGTLTNVSDDVELLPQKYAELMDVFGGVTNRQDVEALERHLAPRDVRDLFYEKLSLFARNLHLTLSSDEGQKRYETAKLNQYKESLKFYQQLRQSVQLRYAERIDYKEFEKRIRKLLNVHVGVEAVESLNDPIDIFNPEALQRTLAEQGGSTASKADKIAYRIKKVVEDRLDEDPIYYRNFSDLVEQSIQDYEQKRISEAQYLASMELVANDLRAGRTGTLPTPLAHNPKARAFYNALTERLAVDDSEATELLAQAGVAVAKLLEDQLIVDWQQNSDVLKRIENEIEDYLITLRTHRGIDISFEQIDLLIKDFVRIARSVYT
ncbi:type I restriction endonuclease subunit R [uncultured Fibrella sp.]|uniref:type I restriction endonuclease subunit R n=1 Tax=uncultured Fibrella sp. TaxID=1284596 RepID=UPI0035CAE2D1